MGFLFHTFVLFFAHFIKLSTGVVGVDILMSELEQQGSYQTVLGQLIQRSSVCQVNTLTACNLEDLRTSTIQKCNNTSGCPQSEYLA